MTRVPFHMAFRRSLRFSAAALVCSLLGGAGAALAGGPLVLVEERIPQYRDAAAAIEAQLPDATRLDVDQATPKRLSQASIILPVGQRALSVAQRQTEGTPLVFSMVLGATRALLGPGVSGVPLEPDPDVALAHVQALLPSIKKVGLIYNPVTHELLEEEAKAASRRRGLTLVTRAVSSAGQVREAVDELAKEVELLWLPADPKLFPKDLVTFLLTLSAERKLPLLGFLDQFTEAGALASVSPDYADIGRRAGMLAAEVLARPEGRRLAPGSVVFAPGNLTLNEKTAKVLGIELPAKAVDQAKRVFR